MAISRGIVCLLVVCLFPSCSGLSTTTTPPPVCEYEGRVFAVGERYDPHPCSSCQCEPDGVMVCTVAGCIVPPCIDYVYLPNKCCPVCPNGPDCFGWQTFLVASGTQVVYEDRQEECECPIAQASEMDQYWPRQLICTPLPTPPTTPMTPGGCTTVTPPPYEGP